MTLNPFSTITMIDAIEDVIDMAQGFGMYYEWYDVDRSEGEQRYYLNHDCAKNNRQNYILSVDFMIKNGNKFPYRISFIINEEWDNTGDLIGICEHAIVISGNILSTYWKIKWFFKLWLMKNTIRRLYKHKALMDKAKRSLLSG